MTVRHCCYVLLTAKVSMHKLTATVSRFKVSVFIWTLRKLVSLLKWDSIALNVAEKNKCLGKISQINTLKTLKVQTIVQCSVMCNRAADSSADLWLCETNVRIELEGGCTHSGTRGG